jgi:hypothetical protein
MLRKGMIVLVSLAFVLTFFVWAENEIAQSFQTCVTEKAAKESSEHSRNQSNSVAVIIKTQALCSLRLVDAHNGFFAALAAILVAAFTFTLWIATDQLAKSGQRIFEATERAFVFLDGFNFELTTRADAKVPTYSNEVEPEWHSSHPELVITRFALQPRWKNGGNTPTKDMTIQINWRTPPYAVLEPKYIYRAPPNPFFLAPKAVEPSEVIEMPMAAALVNWAMKPIGDPPLILIWGRADYEDVFGRKHFVEWCHELRLSRTGGEKMRADKIQWGKYNRTDEDERT